MAEAASVYPPLEARPIKNTICLFDVDGTLTPARLVSSPTSATPPSRKVVHQWLNITTIDPSLARLPRNVTTPLCPPTQVRHRFRWRLRPRETARAARHAFSPSDNPLRFLFLRERAHCVPIGREIGEHDVHRVAWRGKVQEAGQLLLEVYQ